uniref:Carbamoyl-phosphate synthase (glutamine-hydrolyzing) n=1 Tax=Parastrongyloides trichosuri TaxID=131310 RepID=A0A0N4ZZV7_PARTI
LGRRSGHRGLSERLRPIGDPDLPDRIRGPDARQAGQRLWPSLLCRMGPDRRPADVRTPRAPRQLAEPDPRRPDRLSGLCHAGRLAVRGRRPGRGPDRGARPAPARPAARPHQQMVARHQGQSRPEPSTGLLRSFVIATDTSPCAKSRHLRHRSVHAGAVDLERRTGRRLQRLGRQLERRKRRSHRRWRAGAEDAVIRSLHREGLGHQEPLRDGQGRHPRSAAHEAAPAGAQQRRAVDPGRNGGEGRARRHQGLGQAGQRDRRGHLRRVQPAAPLPGHRHRSAAGFGHRRFRFRHERGVFVGDLRHQDGGGLRRLGLGQGGADDVRPAGSQGVQGGGADGVGDDPGPRRRTEPGPARTEASVAAPGQHQHEHPDRQEGAGPRARARRERHHPGRLRQHLLGRIDHRLPPAPRGLRAGRNGKAQRSTGPRRGDGAETYGRISPHGYRGQLRRSAETPARRVRGPGPEGQDRGSVRALSRLLHQALRRELAALGPGSRPGLTRPSDQRKGPLLTERAFVVFSARLKTSGLNAWSEDLGQMREHLTDFTLEATDVADRIGVGFTAVVAEVATGPIAAQAVLAVEVVVGADAVVPAVAADVGVGAGDFLLQLGVAVTAAGEQLQLVVHGVLADHVTSGVPLMLDRAIDAGDGDVVVLDPDRGLGLDGQIAVQVDAQAAGHSAGRGAVAFNMGVAQRAAAPKDRLCTLKPETGLAVLFALLARAGGQRRLRRRQTGDRHAVGRAGDVVQPHLFAEGDGRRVAAMFAADAHLHARLGRATALLGDADQVAHAVLVQTDEGVVLEDALVQIDLQEATGIVAADAEGCLGQVVGAEAEELGVFGQISGAQGSARQFDHGADQIVHAVARLDKDGLGRAVGQLAQIFHLQTQGDQRVHDLRDRGDAGGRLHLQRRLKDGANLHLVDFRVGHAQATAAMA